MYNKEMVHLKAIDLPETEFEIMKVIWKLNPPITTVQIMSELPDKNWKMPTLISLLNRLAARGLLKSEKTGRERLYYPLIGEDEYMNSEIKNVITKYKRISVPVTGLVSALYDGKEISNSDKEELIKWLQSHTN